MKIKNKDRKAYYQQIQLEQKLSYLDHEDKVQLNSMIDKIDALDTSTEEGREQYLSLNNELSKFIDERYDFHLNERLICKYCSKFNSCLRNKNNVRSCSRFEGESNEQN